MNRKSIQIFDNYYEYTYFFMDPLPNLRVKELLLAKNNIKSIVNF